MNFPIELMKDLIASKVILLELIQRLLELSQKL